MPIVEITMVEGRTPDQKKALLRSVTDAIVGALTVPPGNVRIILREIPTAHFAVAGEAKFAPSPVEIED
jgi:4-oxalocrotonate tautomerase